MYKALILFLIFALHSSDEKRTVRHSLQESYDFAGEIQIAYIKNVVLKQIDYLENLKQNITDEYLINGINFIIFKLKSSSVNEIPKILTMLETPKQDHVSIYEHITEVIRCLSAAYNFQFSTDLAGIILDYADPGTGKFKAIHSFEVKKPTIYNIYSHKHDKHDPLPIQAFYWMQENDLIAISYRKYDKGCIEIIDLNGTLIKKYDNRLADKLSGSLCGKYLAIALRRTTEYLHYHTNYYSTPRTNTCVDLHVINWQNGQAKQIFSYNEDDATGKTPYIASINWTSNNCLLYTHCIYPRCGSGHKTLLYKCVYDNDFNIKNKDTVEKDIIKYGDLFLPSDIKYCLPQKRMFVYTYDSKYPELKSILLNDDFTISKSKYITLDANSRSICLIDDEHLAIVYPNKISVFDINENKINEEINMPENYQVLHATCSSDGRLATINEDGQVIIWQRTLS